MRQQSLFSKLKRFDNFFDFASLGFHFFFFPWFLHYWQGFLCPWPQCASKYLRAANLHEHVKRKHDIRQIVPENEDDEESNHPSDDSSRDPTPGPQEQAHLPNEASGKVWRGEDLQEEEVLIKHHLGINQTYGFISCLRKECGTQLSREKWRDHLARMHNDKVKAEEEIVINGMLAQCLVVAIPAGCGPVSGLKLHSGLKCNLCNLFSTSKDALKNHFYKSHPEDQRASVSAWAQRLTATTAYFLVSCCWHCSFNHSTSLIPSRLLWFISAGYCPARACWCCGRGASRKYEGAMDGHVC